MNEDTSSHCYKCSAKFVHIGSPFESIWGIG